METSFITVTCDFQELVSTRLLRRDLTPEESECLQCLTAEGMAKLNHDVLKGVSPERTMHEFCRVYRAMRRHRAQLLYALPPEVLRIVVAIESSPNAATSMLEFVPSESIMFLQDCHRSGILSDFVDPRRGCLLPGFDLEHTALTYLNDDAPYPLVSTAAKPVGDKARKLRASQSLSPMFSWFTQWPVNTTFGDSGLDKISVDARSFVVPCDDASADTALVGDNEGEAGFLAPIASTCSTRTRSSSTCSSIGPIPSLGSSSFSSIASDLDYGHMGVVDISSRSNKPGNPERMTVAPCECVTATDDEDDADHGSVTPTVFSVSSELDELASGASGNDDDDDCYPRQKNESMMLMKGRFWTRPCSPMRRRPRSRRRRNRSDPTLPNHHRHSSIAVSSFSNLAATAIATLFEPMERFLSRLIPKMAWSGFPSAIFCSFLTPSTSRVESVSAIPSPQQEEQAANNFFLLGHRHPHRRRSYFRHPEALRNRFTSSVAANDCDDVQAENESGEDFSGAEFATLRAFQNLDGARRCLAIAQSTNVNNNAVPNLGDDADDFL